MNITVTNQEHCKRQVRLEIPGEVVRTETDQVAAKLARQVNVPGFRPGHVPTSVVKTRFRKEVRDEVLSHLLPNSLAEAVREKELKVIGEPSVENIEFAKDESIDVTFLLEVAPEFELANYKSLPLTRRTYKIRQEEVDKAVDDLRERQAEMVPVEDRGAQTKDTVTANLTGRFEPAPVEEAGTTPGGAAPEEPPEESALQGGKAAAAGQSQVESKEDLKQDDVEIELGAKGVLNEFSTALDGARAGDTRTFVVEYPADYSSKQLAGRRIRYTADVTGVRVKELPVVDDDFAKSVDDNYGNVAEMRADVRAKLEHQAEHKSADELRGAAVEQLVNRNRFEVPEYVVEKELDTRLQTFVAQLQRQGVDARKLKVNWEDLREAQREAVERQVRASFIIERIAEAEAITVSEDELNRELESIAARQHQSVAALKARLTKDEALDSIERQIRSRKALDLVIDSAETRTEEIDGLEDAEARASESGAEVG